MQTDTLADSDVDYLKFNLKISTRHTLTILFWLASIFFSITKLGRTIEFFAYSISETYSIVTNYTLIFFA